MTNSSDTVFDSRLTKYNMTLLLGKYERPKPFKNTKPSWTKKIVMPLPTQLADRTVVDFRNENLETVGDIVNDSTISGTAGAFALRNAGGPLTALASTVVGTGLGTVAGQLGGGTTRGNLIAAGVGGFTAMNLANIFPADRVTSALQQTIGMAPNPNPSVMFDGPHLRNFSFSWTIVPKNRDEGLKLKKIIDTLKMCQLPSTTMESSAAVLNYPYLCQVNFYPWDAMSGGNEWGWGPDSIIKIKRCFITDCDVNYTSQNSPAFNGADNRPVATTITIGLQEVEYMLSNDWGGDLGSMGLGEFGASLGGSVVRLFPGGDTLADAFSGKNDSVKENSTAHLTDPISTQFYGINPDVPGQP